jgi:signal transduction histidine kinase
MSNNKILVVDDEIGICEGVRRALIPQGYLVDIALSAKDGLRKVKENLFELVMLDVMMPDISGIDLMKLIHEHDADIVCIIITGYATVELAVKAIKSGAYDFLTKPFTVDDLYLIVSHGLEHRYLSLEARRVQSIEAFKLRLEQEKNRLVELDLAKQQFIRLVTHELKAPVAAIQNYLELMQEGYVPAEQQKDIIEKCQARAEEEVGLITDILELGKLQVLDKSVRENPLAIDKILEQILVKFQAQIDQKKIKLHTNIEHDLPKIIGVQNQFNSLWSNLIGNAIKYTPQDGCIKIKLRRDNDQIIGEVQDTGSGIPKDDLSKLFTEFFRAKNAKSANIPGSGLGLVIAKRVVENAGGTLTVTSEEGKGTCFTFLLPMQQKHDTIEEQK